MCKDGILLCHTIDCLPFNSCLSDINSSCCPACSIIDKIKSPVITSLSDQNYWFCLDRNNNKRAHGSIWKENDCLSCICVNGESKCINEQCPKLNCFNKIYKKGNCCPYCLEKIVSDYILANSFIEDYFPQKTTGNKKS
jgi:cysteine-rich motor neuron 1 protein